LVISFKLRDGGWWTLGRGEKKKKKNRGTNTKKKGGIGGLVLSNQTPAGITGGGERENDNAVLEKKEWILMPEK